MKNAILIIGMILLLSVVSAEVIQISPEVLEPFSIYSGESVEYNITIKTDGDYLVYLDYSIENNTYNMDGFNIDMPKSVFVEREKEIAITISTVYNYFPDSFSIIFTASTEKAEEEITINFNNEIITFGDLELEINGTGNITIKIFKQNPGIGFGIPSLNKFFEITSVQANNNSIIKVYYTDEEVNALGIDENTLRLYFFNNTLNDWQIQEGGVNTELNYVWAKTNHFSLWGIFGDLIPGKPPTRGSSSCSYNRNYDWKCSEWSECANGEQTRTCKEKNNCYNTYGRPNVVQSCVEPNITDIDKDKPVDIEEPKSNLVIILGISILSLLIIILIVLISLKPRKKLYET